MTATRTKHAAWMPPSKPVFDWNAITPRCKGCSEKSGVLNADDLCPTCVDPRPAVVRVATPRSTPRPRATTTRRAPTPRPRRQRESKPRRGQINDVAGVLADYRGGQTIAQVAQAHSVSISSVRRLLVLEGVQLRDDRTTNSGGGNHVPEAQRAEVVRLYGTGLSQTQIAEQVGVSSNTVGRITRAAGIEGRRSGYAGKDTLSAARQRLEDLGATSRDIRAWAATAGLACADRGLPPSAVVEAYAAAHPNPEKETTP